MKRILIAALAATTMWMGVSSAQAAILLENPKPGELVFEDGQNVDLIFVDDDPTVDDMTVILPSGLGLSAEYDDGRLHVFGKLLTVQPWGPRTLPVTSYDAGGNQISFALYQIVTAPETMSPVIATDLSVTATAGTTVTLTRSDLILAGDDDPDAEISYMHFGGVPAGFHPSTDSGGNLKVVIDSDATSADLPYLVAKNKFPATSSYSETHYVHFDIQPADGTPPVTSVGCNMPSGLSSKFVFRSRRTGVLPCS